MYAALILIHIIVLAAADVNELIMMQGVYRSPVVN